MSIIRIFRGQNNTPERLKALIKYLVIAEGKNVWKGVSYQNLPNRVQGYLVANDVTDAEAVYDSLMAPHLAYGDLGPHCHLFYHILIDFNAAAEPPVALEVGGRVASWFRRFWVQYITGLHCVVTKKNVFQPHIHLLVNTIKLDGSGRKFMMDKNSIYQLRDWTNEILREFGIPEISGGYR